MSDDKRIKLSSSNVQSEVMDISNWVLNWEQYLKQLCTSPDSYQLISNNTKTLSIDGVIKKGDEVVVMKANGTDVEFIVMNLKRHSMILFDNSRGEKLSETYLGHVEENYILDLTADGKRWEGNVRNGQPFGYGCLYDEDNNIQYEGYMINEKKIGYGTDYWSDIGVLKYRGCWCDGMKHGYGMLQGRTGSLEHEGYFNHGIPVTNTFFYVGQGSSFPYLHSQIRHLHLADQYSVFQSASSMFPYLMSLKRLIIEPGKQLISSYRFRYFPSLESLKVTLTDIPVFESNQLFEVAFCRCLKEVDIDWIGKDRPPSPRKFFIPSSDNFRPYHETQIFIMRS